MEPEKIKESILRAAKELFRKYGYHKTSVNEIAKKARIAKATIYKYFDSKEQVLDAILMDYLDVNLHEILSNKVTFENEEEHLKALVMKTCRLSYTVCNEFIGWDFVRENANSQEFLKHLSDQLEALLLSAYLQLDHFKNTILEYKSEKKWTKEDIVSLFHFMIPSFGHKETGLYLDGKM